MKSGGPPGRAVSEISHRKCEAARCLHNSDPLQPLKMLISRRARVRRKGGSPENTNGESSCPCDLPSPRKAHPFPNPFPAIPTLPRDGSRNAETIPKRNSSELLPAEFGSPRRTDDRDKRTFLFFGYRPVTSLKIDESQKAPLSDVGDR